MVSDHLVAQVKHYRLSADVLRLVECRVREGFKDGRATLLTGDRVLTAPVAPASVDGRQLRLVAL